MGSPFPRAPSPTFTGGKMSDLHRSVDGCAGVSQMTQDEFDGLLSYIPASGKTWLLEVGTYEGATAAQISDLRPLCNILSVDVFLYPTWGSYKKNKRPGMSLFWGDTRELSLHVPDKSYHVVFIDGSHQYEPVKRDLEICGGMVFPGGSLLLHDYHPTRYPGVVQAAQEYAADRGMKVHVIAGTLAEIRK